MVKKYRSPASLLLLLFCAFAPVDSQVVPAARGGSHLDAGFSVSDFSPGYPNYIGNRLLGIGFYLDFNVGAHLGAEGEARFLRFNQQYQVHEDNYLLGPRYLWHFNRLEPYAKFLVGNGQYNFPFGYAHGGYLMLAPGGGLDIRLSHRFTARAIDYEYQYWSGFQNSSISPNGFTFGIAYRIF